VFLLLWDKDSYTERLLELLPCTCVLKPTLVHFYQTSSLLLGLLPKVASANLRLLYLLLNREHIQVLGFLPFPYSSQAHSPLSVWPVSNNIPTFHSYSLTTQVTVSSGYNFQILCYLVYES
jgi:hypothetical protein